MIVRVRDATRALMANAIRDELDAGGAAATLALYTAPMPATPDAPITTQVRLGTLTLSRPCAPDSPNGTLTLFAITGDSAADASGTAAWARFADSMGAGVIDLDVTAAGEGGALELDDPELAAGEPIAVASAAIEVPFA